MRTRGVSRRVADVTALVERGIARGEPRSDLDPELVTDLLLGPLHHRRRFPPTLWPVASTNNRLRIRGKRGRLCLWQRRSRLFRNWSPGRRRAHPWPCT
ncbi:hypothetical protein ETU37_21105 [Nocardioides iriomotensis]|uniref:Tetracyclin repressor-like C-terminal domain-containing protein n=1 Tax=Nocardioides iriomotensis TaxID=715784 RepID=A0A4Q5IX27_9ACTN|nr:hypothetical protein ETU37_21105 [Nocardioides iriomotensis]